MNPKYFKKQKKGSFAQATFNSDDPNTHTSWKKTLHHELTHSIDHTNTSNGRRSYNDEKWNAAERLERRFTDYANTEAVESFAEHGGYYSYMKSNPQDHHLTITVRDNHYQKIKITFDEYKKLYPKHVEYFEDLFYSNKITLENEKAMIKQRIRDLQNLITTTKTHIRNLESTDTARLIKQYTQYQNEMLQQLKEAKQQGQYDLVDILMEEYKMYKEKVVELKRTDPKEQIKENKKKLKEYETELKQLKRRL